MGNHRPSNLHNISSVGNHSMENTLRADFPPNVIFQGDSPCGSFLTKTPAKETKRSKLFWNLCILEGFNSCFNPEITKFSLTAFYRHSKLSPVFNGALELWSHEPAVSTSLLKLMTEIAQNRSQRLFFDVMSPNGVLLFRQISKTIVIYGEYQAKAWFPYGCYFNIARNIESIVKRKHGLLEPFVWLSTE